MAWLQKRSLLSGSKNIVLNWINPQLWSPNNIGISIDSITWSGGSSGDIGQTIEFDVKFNKSSYSQRECLIGKAGEGSLGVLRVNGANTFIFHGATWSFSGLNLFDGEYHHIKLEKVTSTETALSVDSFVTSPKVISVPNDKIINRIATGATTTGYFNPDGIIKNFIAKNSSSVITHDIKINDDSAVLKNTGETSDGLVIGTQGTDYIWEKV